ncbi:hypothetical protein FRC10_010091 [Ceratobasidium sp. 414]|nr:hypothetical protein FRC10_010091 [Ceratobasidium sp. 414]
MARLGVTKGTSSIQAARMFVILGESYDYRYQQLGQLEDEEMATECYTQAMSHIPRTSTERPAILSDMGSNLLVRFKATGKLPDLDRALECLTQAMSSSCDGRPASTGDINNLGIAYLMRFEHLGEMPDLELALEHYTRAESLTPGNHPDRPGRLSNLGNAYRYRYQHQGQIADLDAAIHYHRQANLASTKDHPDKPRCLDNLATSHQVRYTQLRDISDLDVAIEYDNQVILLVSDDDPDKPGYLANLGGAYGYRYQRQGLLPDLDMAIEHHRRAISLTPDGHLQKPWYLQNLGVSYRARYERLGHLADLDDSITCGSQALHLTPDGYRLRPVLLGNLGASHRIRFGRLSHTPDSDAAIEYLRQAASLTPDGHPDKITYLSDLGTMHYTRYVKGSQLTDLEIAIKFHSQVVTLAPDGDQNIPEYFTNLGGSYHARYLGQGELSDLNLAIQHQQHAVSHAPEDHPRRHQFLSNLGVVYKTRYECQNLPEDLDLAIDYLRLATSVMPDDHYEGTERLTTLGHFLSLRFNRSQDPVDISNSIECFKRAAHSSASDPREKALAAYDWATHSYQYQPQPSLEGFQHLMALIPQVVWLGMNTHNRYQQLTKVASATLVAALAAIGLQTCDQALEWLEQGRSVVWNQLLQLRSPLGGLKAVDALLAEELEDVASQIQSSPGLKSSMFQQADTEPQHEESAQRYRRLVERWEQLIHRAQSLPGMNDFLAPRRATELIEAATRNGALVVVIVHEKGCAALVVRPEARDITCIPLPSLSHCRVAQASGELVRGQHQDRARADRKFIKQPKSNNKRETLCMLWADIAKPVLDFLGYTKVLPLSGLPRITWCTTGPLSFLPLHAAGDYSKPDSSLFHYAVSSYTPTLSALLVSPPEQDTFSGLLTVGQASTPGFSPLPGTTQELDNIAQKATQAPTMRLEAERATREGVLEAMEKYSWVHLACHASQNPTNPTASAFHLHDGPLDLATIAQKHFKNADLAFLSACQTAAGDRVLSEESMHLAAGMVMAGYRTVVATMWPVVDEDAPLVADRFYEYMLKDGVPDGRNAARALHYAAGCLRDQVGVEAYSRWAPYIHLGQ